ncbi:MAG: glycoside hydrolase family 130 protein [Nocardiaceae bacterium]|nr:glycoside hydrolase family 130 protein [Nocardiaceae bacterium]
MTNLVRRSDVVLLPNPRRVLARLFLPGQELHFQGVSRADAIIGRVLAMSDADVLTTLTAVTHHFASRHRDISAVFAEHFGLVRHRIKGTLPGGPRAQLMGACFTQEYAVEAAALFNPSMVAHPDQSGLEPAQLRFIMSVRAVGEGHISSIEFRTGVIGSDDLLTVDEPARYLEVGRFGPAPLSRELIRAMLDDEASSYVLSLLPPKFDLSVLESALASVGRDRLTRGSTDVLIERIRRIASGGYTLEFDSDITLSARAIFPSTEGESHGIEDARFTRFVEDDGTVSYYATYTAFNGDRVSPRLMHTADFTTFEVSQLAGESAQDKGMALFPRKIDGSYWMLSRWDRENISVAQSEDLRIWGPATTIHRPTEPWELIQLGNCGSPIETEAGWLVLTHGVGAVRTYAMGAILLDLADPTRVIGRLSEPLLVPEGDERNGYVPSVVYSCGALIHDDVLVLPYGCSDSAVRFGFVDVRELLARFS